MQCSSGKPGTPCACGQRTSRPTRRFELIVGVVTMLISRRNLPAALALRSACRFPPRGAPPGRARSLGAYRAVFRHEPRKPPAGFGQRVQPIHRRVRRGTVSRGFTLRTTYGQFLNSRGESIREKSFLVIVFYPSQMHDADAAASRDSRAIQADVSARIGSSRR